MMFGPDGRLYAGATRDAGRSSPTTRRAQTEVLAEDATVNDLAVNVKGDIYFTDTAGKKVWLLPKGGKPRVVDEGIEQSERRAVLARSDAALRLRLHRRSCRGPSRFSRTARWRTSSATSTSTCRTRRRAARADGMAVDADGRVYIATALGVQVFDQIGKCHAIIPAPQRAALSNVEFGGRELRRDVRHQRRQGVQAQDEGEGRAVVASADQAGAAAVVAASLRRLRGSRLRALTATRPVY